MGQPQNGYTLTRYDDGGFPTASCELLPARFSSILAAVLQILIAIIKLLVYEKLEAHGFILERDTFRIILITTEILCMTGSLCAIFGCILSRKVLVTLHAYILSFHMFFSDFVALMIILCMAIGNRVDYIDQLPRRLVSRTKFYSVLGPFWMYLGAITLHITVSVNMCFLTIFKSYLKTFEKASLRQLPLAHEMKRTSH